MHMPPSPLENAYDWRASIGLALVALLVMGFLYSLAGAGLGRVLFPHQATGSIIERDGQRVGSALIAQPFVSDRYFYARPSAVGYDPMSTAGSNLARSNPALRARMQQLRAAVAAREGIAPAAVPPELITASGSGLDPHLSPAGAQVQIERVARARGLDPTAVAALVARHTEPPQFGLIGPPRVNVLTLNLALDELQPKP